MFAREEKVAHGLAFHAREGGPLAGLVAGVAAFCEGKRGPVEALGHAVQFRGAAGGNFLRGGREPTSLLRGRSLVRPGSDPAAQEKRQAAGRALLLPAVVPGQLKTLVRVDV